MINQSRLLDSIGTAHMEQEIVRTVLKIGNEQQEALAEQPGVEASLTQEDLKVLKIGNEQQDALAEQPGVEASLTQEDLKVLKIGNEQQEALAEQPGVEASLTQEDLKDYLAEVMEEVKRIHSKQL